MERSNLLDMPVWNSEKKYALEIKFWVNSIYTGYYEIKIEGLGIMRFLMGQSVVKCNLD